MIIRSVEFVTSVALPGTPVPEDLPQVAFSGRSNVGKSSLINVLVGRTQKKLAQVSSRPGKTQTLNFYRVNRSFYLVDLPGYGYARAPAALRREWKELVEWYLGEGSPCLKGIVHLVDGRHPPSPLDQKMMEFLAGVGVPTLVILTKMDRVRRSGWERAVAEAANVLGVETDQVLPFSSKTGEGRQTLMEALEALLQEQGRWDRAITSGRGAHEASGPTQ